MTLYGCSDLYAMFRITHVAEEGTARLFPKQDSIEWSPIQSVVCNLIEKVQEINDHQRLVFLENVSPASGLYDNVVQNAIRIIL